MFDGAWLVFLGLFLDFLLETFITALYNCVIFNDWSQVKNMESIMFQECFSFVSANHHKRP
jgi:hypothetical protein